MLLEAFPKSVVDVHILIVEGHSIRSLRIHIAARVAVIAWVGVDETPNRTALRRHFRLDTAPGAAVASDDNLSRDVDAAPLEFVVIARHPVVDIHELTGDVPIDRVGVVARELLVVLTRRAVFAQRRLCEGGSEAGRRHHFESPNSRGREEDLIRLDRRLVAPLAKALGDKFSHLSPKRRPHVVRT